MTPPASDGVIQFTQGAGLYMEGEWAGGNMSSNGLSFYGNVDVGGVDLSVSARGGVIEQLKAIPIGHWVRLSVAMRETASGAFFAVRRVESTATLVAA